MKKLGNKKKIILGSILGIFIGALLGTTYAMYTYNSSSVNNKLIAGDIYMKYKETSAINLSGAMPSATYPDSTTGNYFEFQIVGKNTSSKDITYNVKLAYGDEELDANDNPKTRIDDERLVFKLVEVVNNEEVSPALVNDRSFNSIPGSTLYTATIPGEGASATESTRTFRVYARISENVVIGNTNQDYTLAEWNNLYASVKINVDGGFNGGSTPVEPEEDTLIPNATPASCFTTSENQDGTLTITGYDADTCGTDVVIPNIIDVNQYPPTGVSNDNNSKNNLSFMPNKIETNNYNELVKKTTNENWKRVTIIGEESFYCYTQGWNQEEGNETYITSVIIPDTVTTIGNHAFSVNQIESIIIPNSVTSIGDYAFYENSLTSLTIPNSVTTIGDYAFGLNSINNLTLNMTDLSIISEGAFSIDENGTSLTINNAQVIPDYFESNLGTENITSLTLGNSVTTIGSYAFKPGGDYNANSFDTLVIPNSVTTIGESAFQQNNIVSLTLSNNLTTIGDWAFSENYGLSNVVIPNSVTTIGSYAFAANSIAELTIPSSVQTIGDSAFSSNSITSLTLNMNDLTGIGSGVFEFDSNGVSLTINNATIIPNDMFRNSYINTLNLGNSIITIGDSAFTQNSIQELTIPNSVQTIGDYAFSENYVLESIVIPNSVTTIGSYAFDNNSIAELTIPNSVTTIGDSAFYGNSIAELTIQNGVTTIGDSAFYGNSIAELTIPNSVTTIGTSAFSTNSLTNLTLPGNVTTIGDYAFGYNSITNLTINMYDLTGLNINKAFSEENSYNQMSLVDTVIVNNATIIPDDTFHDSHIDNLILGNNVTTIGSRALELYSPSTNISLPSTVTSIASDAFGSDGYSYNISFSKSCTDITAISGYPFGADSWNIHDNDNNICGSDEIDEG